MRIGCFLSTEEYTPAELIEQVKAYEQAGIDEVYVTSIGPHSAELIDMYKREFL